MSMEECRLLIVDDQEPNRRTLQALLTPLGCQLDFAADGVSALAQAAATPPDLVLLDVMMPGIDGFEVCRRLRADDQLGEIPIIMITALDDRESRLRGLEAGADDFITKPIDRLELRARVQSILRLNRYRRLTTERQRFAWVVDHSDDGYVVVTAIEDRVLSVNARARELLGLAAGVGPAEVFGALLDREYQSEPAGAWASGETSFLAVRPETDKAAALWLRVDVLDHRTNGQGAERLVRLRDVTAQMRLQREAWSFHTFVAHKLRTPISGLMGSLELLMDTATEAHPPERNAPVMALLEMALRSVVRLNHDVDEVLSYMSASADGRQGVPLVVDRLPGMVDALAHELGLTQVQARVAPEASQLAVWPTERALVHILTELMSNAQKFHPTHAPAIEIVAARAEGNFVRLTVASTGPTLPASELGRIWQPYYQVEKSLTGEVAGMGLGLALVAALVLGVGGQYRAYNRPDGTGLALEFLLPIAQYDLALMHARVLSDLREVASLE